MELNDFRHSVIACLYLVNDMLICSSDYEVLIEKAYANDSQSCETSGLQRKEGIISSTDSKSSLLTKKWYRSTS
ncbi:hypothetical protein TNCV_4364711 [Trichonephila clavipes]|nr:hypothetical protein TNCV_4364711 [Trichonephila clavipes]